MPPLTAECTVRIIFPPERRFLDLVLHSALGHLRLYPLGRPALQYIRKSLAGVSRRVDARSATGRGRIEIRSHRGKIRIVLRFPPGTGGVGKLAALAGRAPSGVVATLRPARRGGTFSIQAPLARPE